MASAGKKLIVIKLGTSSLTESGGELSPAKMKHITDQVAELHKTGCRMIIVTSGAVAAGYSKLGYSVRPSSIPAKQASAAVGQGLLMEEYARLLDAHGIVTAQILLTRDDFRDKTRYKNAFAAMELLIKRGAIPIVNENDSISTDEIRLGDNDTLSAQVAAMVHADLLMLLTDIDGLYTGDPRSDKDAVLIERVESVTQDMYRLAGGAGSANGTGGMATKLRGAKLATSAGVPVVICASTRDDAISDAAKDRPVGTYFAARKTNMKTRLQWMAFYADCAGNIYVDEGAASALTEGEHSLLPSGIRAAEGDFFEGDVVKVYRSGSGEYLGKGIIEYSKSDLIRLIARPPEDIKKLSHKGRPEAINRDNWVENA